MDLFVNDGRGFQRQYIEDSLDRDSRIWSRRRVPSAWLRAYENPVIILTNGFTTSLIDVLRNPAETDFDFVGAILEDVKEDVEFHYDFTPDLPPPRFVGREGGLENWRRREGHFLASRCNGCGEVHPSYWLETERDVVLANAMERRHPAIAFLKRAIVTFHGREFVGCYCSAWEEQHPGKPYEPAIQSKHARRAWRAA